MDDETAALIIQIQIEDSRELFERLSGKGKGREDELSDAQIALQIYMEELQGNAAIIADRRMTRSIAHACQTDGVALTAVLSQEHDCASDHEAACRLSGVEITAPLDPWTVTSEFLDEELLEKLKALYVATPAEGAEIEAIGTADEHHERNVVNQPEGSDWAASRLRKVPKRRCIACQEQFQFWDIARVPCSHEYCRACLKELFQVAIHDDSLFPPKCCKQPIVPDRVRVFLTPELVDMYERKKIEFETQDRTYCSNLECSSFLRVEGTTQDRIRCSICQQVTCTMCKGKEHAGDCPADSALQEVLTVASENGWRRCTGCRAVVELSTGCNHITCRCGSQFCYLCGERWKSCQCAQWDEDRLLARANQVVARQPRQINAQAQVAAVAENLRTRHNCEHRSWRYVGGQHQCEECRDTLHSYIFECTQCNIQACNRCRHNRL